MSSSVRKRYYIYGLVFQILCLSANFAAIFFLASLLGSIIGKGYSRISLDFLTSYPSRNASMAGIIAPIVGTTYMMLLTALISVPMGVGAAIYLEEYARNTRFVRFVKINIQNLAGVPSIIYGILGLTIFIRFMGLGRSLLAGALTMALVIMPVITIATQEALRGVPESFRLAGFGIGMTRWQVVRYQLMPVALPGIMTGIILALSRAIGESAPLIMTGALTFVAFLPANVLDSFTVLPIQIFNWTSRPQKEFHELAAAAIIVLLFILLIMNGAAIYLRAYFRRRVVGAK